MKKLIIVCVVFLMAATFVNAQNFDLAVKAGLNLSNNVGRDIDMNIKPGVNLGVTADIYLTGNFFFQPGFFYSLKGSKDKGTVIVGDIAFQGTEKIQLHYLELPLSIGYKLDMGFVIFMAHTGPYIAVGVSGKDTVDGRLSYNDIGGSIDTSVNAFGDGGLKRGDIGWNIGAGVRVGKIYGGLQYGIGMLNLGNSDVKIRNGNLSINAGYYF